MAGERFNRETGPRLAEAPPADPVEAELETSGLLTRLEQHAAESGRLEGRVQTLERALKAEREARRRLGETLQRERRAALTVHERGQHARHALAAASEELEGLREALAVTGQHAQASWARVAQLEHELAWKARPAWRKLLGRPPAV